MQTNTTRTVVRLMPNPMAALPSNRVVAVTLPFIRALDEQIAAERRADREDPDALAGHGRYGEAY